MFKKIKNLFGGKEKKAEEIDTTVVWMEADAEENPFGVRLLDLRPFSLNMISVSQNQEAAQNALSYGQDDGSSFAAVEPESDREVTINLRYKTDNPLLCGALFIPEVMENKWAVFYHDSKILFIRSWTRAVQAVCEVEQLDGEIHLKTLRGSFYADDESVEMSEKVIDYLIRSHVLNMVTPVPLPEEPVDLQAEAAMCFSHFGSKGLIAAHEDYKKQEITTPLRSFSSMHIAVAKGDLESVRKFKEQGISFNALAADGLSPLHWAFAQEGTEMADYLLENGADVDCASDEGATPLMSACQNRNLDIVEYLINQGADVNAKDLRGFTSMHRAAEMGETAIVKKLIEAGADVKAEAQGHTPLSLAEQRNETAIIDLLKANM